MEQKRIKEIRERCDKATPGQWESGYFQTVSTKTGHKLLNTHCDLDAIFIAHAREDIPELLEEIDRLAGELAKHYEANGMKTAYDNDGTPYLVEAEGSEAEHIIELLTAEGNGRLHISPCADGTKIVLLNTEDHSDYQEESHEIDSYHHGLTEYEYGEMGKDWVIAEAALNEEKWDCRECQREDAPCEYCIRNKENTDKEAPDLKDHYYHDAALERKE